MTSCTGSVGWGFWGFEKKQGVEFLPPNERVKIQSWARPDEFVCYGHHALVGLRADDVKAVSIERLCLSLSLSLSTCRKTFKLKKVNKSFVPEPISCFQIPIYVYEHFMNIMSISHIHIMGILQLEELLKLSGWVILSIMDIVTGNVNWKLKYTYWARLLAFHFVLMPWDLMVMVIVIGNGHDTSSNLRQGWLHFI